jgi:dihydroorotate dehydrogenase
LGGRVTLVAVGGIETADDIWEYVRAGATLVQLYTALIYQGPALPTRLARELSAKLDHAGLTNIAELRDQA